MLRPTKAHNEHSPLTLLKLESGGYYTLLELTLTIVLLALTDGDILVRLIKNTYAVLAGVFILWDESGSLRNFVAIFQNSRYTVGRNLSDGNPGGTNTGGTKWNR